MSTLKPMRNNNIETRVMDYIKTCFPEYPCTPGDIRNPKREFVTNFFCYFLEQLRILPSYVMLRPIEKQLEHDSHPELHSDILQLLNLTQTLQAILSKIQNQNSPDFGLDDIIEPKFARNTLFMFSLLNFYSFADTRISLLHEKLDVVSTRSLVLEEMMEKQRNLSKEINERAIKRGKTQDFAKEIKMKKSEMEEISRESKSLDEFCEKKHSELEDVKRRVSRVHDEICELEKMVQQLESNQVQSPDALKNNYQHLLQKLEDSKQQLEQTQKNSKEKKEHIQLFETLMRDHDVRHALLLDICQEAKTVKELQNQLSDASSKIQNEIKDNETSLNQLSGLKKKCNDLVEQVTNSQLQRDKIKRGLQETIRHLKDEKGNLDLQQNALVSNVLESIEKVKTEVDDLLELNNKLNKYYQEMYARLNEKEQEFINRKLQDYKQKNQDLNEQIEAKLSKS